MTDTPQTLRPSKIHSVIGRLDDAIVKQVDDVLRLFLDLP
jgi:hypothetical protein